MTKQDKRPAQPAIEMVPLADLYLSDLNPRQDVDEESIELLAESLVTCGLIQNLSGLRDDKGKVAIVAGGRRLRALQKAVLDAPHLDPVPVRIAPDVQTAETWANVENAARADLHPADEIRAFGKMYAKSLGISRIAKAFATTEDHVRRRLALAELPDPVLDALKAGEISLSAAAAFTVSPSKKRTLEVLDTVRGQDLSAHRIKTLLKPDAIRPDDARALFVGKDAYIEAGGRVTTDLFSDQEMFDDPDLLDDLFKARLKEEVEKIRAEQGWKWCEACEDRYLGFYDLGKRKFERVYPEQGVLNDEQAERYDELAELAEGDVLDEAGMRELAELQAILDGEYTAAQKAVAGIIAHVDYEGELRILAGLIKPEDRAQAVEAGVLARPRGADGDQPKSPYSQKLMDDLERIRTGARQHAALNAPDLLLDLLAFQLSGRMGYREAFRLRAEQVANMPDTETGYRLDERLTTPAPAPKDPWGGDLARSFKAFQKKGRKFRDGELLRFLASLLCAGDPKLAQLIDKRIGTDIRAVWTPTAENFFKRVSGAHLDEIWRDLLDLAPDHPGATSFARLKKGEKAERLEKLFSDPAMQEAHGVTDAQKARIDTWLPAFYADKTA